MYFYVDESGQTGLNLFDKTQPHLYYGVLSSNVNLDLRALKTIEGLRNKLEVDRLHASQLGNARLVEIIGDIEKLKKKFNLKFDFYKINKVDHALISFFDQAFDQGLNPAVPWSAYWTPLRYIMIVKLASLFDEETLVKAWKARITTNNVTAEQLLTEVCSTIIGRVAYIPDARSREIIRDGLSWVIQNPDKIQYNADCKHDALQISPNLVGFQSVLHGIALRIRNTGKKAKRIVVDRQSQFNAAQEYVTQFYQKARDVPWISGPGLPVMDLTNMPTIPISCTAGTESVGLEIVDIYIWVFKRYMEGKELAPELEELIRGQQHRGKYDEVSIAQLTERWGKWFDELPELSEMPDENVETAMKILAEQENKRKGHVI